MEQRRAQLRTILTQQHLDGLFLSSAANIRYLSGYQGEDAWLLILSNGGEALITDFRYQEQAQQECGNLPVLLHRRDGLSIAQIIAAQCEQAGAHRLAIESDFMTIGDYRQLEQNLGGITLCLSSGLTEKLRLIKDQDEVALIKAACRKTDRVFAQICAFIHPHCSEDEVAIELDRLIAQEDCRPAFATIVAAGINGSRPHHQAQRDKLLHSGELITMDFGCKYRGYCADMTRTVALGTINQQQRQIYQLVLDAQLAACAGLRPGLPLQQGDQIARNIITAAGFGENFGHSLGHGLGLDIHEAPTLSLHADGILEAGSVVTVEPGIYVPGLGGVRIEDTVLITPQGCQILFDAPKQLQIL
ncbi:MAG: Xaa-Pro peptidase family protein [Clostridiales bacterium]